MGEASAEFHQVAGLAGVQDLGAWQRQAHLHVRKAFFAAALLASLPVTPSLAANISVKDWGTTQQGAAVQLYTLKGARGLEAHISNFGGVIVDLLVPTKSGDKADVML